MRIQTVRGSACSTPLCDQCRNDVMDLIEKSHSPDFFLDLSVEFQARALLNVYVVRTRGDFSAGEHILKLLLCEACCGKAKLLLEATAGSSSQMQLLIDRDGPVCEPLIAMRIPPAHVSDGSPIPKRPASTENLKGNGLWWHTG